MLTRREFTLTGLLAGLSLLLPFPTAEPPDIRELRTFLYRFTSCTDWDREELDAYWEIGRDWHEAWVEAGGPTAPPFIYAAHSAVTALAYNSSDPSEHDWIRGALQDEIDNPSVLLAARFGHL